MSLIARHFAGLAFTVCNNHLVTELWSGFGVLEGSMAVDGRIAIGETADDLGGRHALGGFSPQ
jgi:hypothetical protein